MKKSLFAIAMIACACLAANAGRTIYVSAATGNDAVADGSEQWRSKARMSDDDIARFRRIIITREKHCSRYYSAQ